MGSCFSRCLPRCNGRRDTAEFTYLVEDRQHQERRWHDDWNSCGGFLARLFAKRKSRRKHKKPVLELVDGLLNPQLATYSRLSESQRLPSASSCTSRDIPLQCLDARALLARTSVSTPVGSVDLEWEHETLPISNDASGSSWTALPEDFLDASLSESSTNNTMPVAANSDSDWSRVSSANSLEWDNVPQVIEQSNSPPLPDMDADTQMLLSEIERLTMQTLQETGKELFS